MRRGLCFLDANYHLSSHLYTNMHFFAKPVNTGDGNFQPISSSASQCENLPLFNEYFELLIKQRFHLMMEPGRERSRD